MRIVLYVINFDLRISKDVNIFSSKEILISYAWFKVIKGCVLQVDFERVGYNHLYKQE